MTRSVLRAAMAALVTVAVVLGGAVSAQADDNATLTSVARQSDGSLSGVLTVRASKDSATVDPASLSLTVGGKSYPITIKAAASADRSTILLIDRSGSMGSKGMTTVRTAVDQFVSLVPADVKVGVVSFADQATVDVPPSQDRAAVLAAVKGLTAQGDTALYNAVALAVQTLGSTGERSIVLLSDGKDTITPNAGSATEQILKASGVRTEVIAFNTNSTDDLALGFLAAAGQGKVTQVTRSDLVAQAFSDAARALDSQVLWSTKPDGTVFGKQDVVLKGRSNLGDFTATSTVDFGAAPSTTTSPTATASASVTTAPVVAAAAPSADGTSTGAGGLMSQTVAGLPFPVAIASLLLFIAILLAVMALLSPAFKSARKERVEAIEQYVTQTARRTTDAVRTTNVTGFAESLVQMGERAVEGRESTPKTVLLLQRADLPWRAGEWAVLRVIALVVGALLGILLLHEGLLQIFLGGVLGLALGVVAPPFVLAFLARRRAKKFERQLPDVLTLVASSLSTGFSLPQALDAVSHDVGQPAAKEFSRAMAETRIGSDLEEALDRMAERMDSTNMKWATMAIGIQRKVGGNLAETLRQTATTLREREALFRHVRALSAEGRLSAWILIALPIAIFLWMLYVNGEYVSLLWKSIIGMAMSIMAIILMVIGVFWMRKVVEVEV